MGDDLKQDLKVVADSLRDLAAIVNNLGTKLDDLTVKVDRLAPLAPVASKLTAVLEKITTLQSAQFENNESMSRFEC
jgi:hypothetical protein